MNGAIALDCEKTINSPNRMNITTMGASQYFFSCRRNCQNSLNTRALPMRPSVHSQIVLVVAVPVRIGTPARVPVFSALEWVLSDESPDQVEWHECDREEHRQQNARIDIAKSSCETPP